MAIKSMIFLLALMFLATRLASSVEDIDNVLAQHILHVKSASKGPVYGPSVAPIPAPKKPPTKGENCVQMCTKFCKAFTPKRTCMKSCTACCAIKKCVPILMECDKWDKVKHQGKIVKCP